ncbi:MAG: N-acetylmuramoyl-L-alanine amidase, partial [Verrucomicrobiota bacterium]|nr:N-acetylmuramoyl-L-alanine amidase [Verrucomicrobiota bacterium]
MRRRHVPARAGSVGRTRTVAGRARRWTAWAGFALMVVSVIWLELLPHHDDTSAETSAPESARGSITGVIIDAGHGGQDSGAEHAGVQEKNLTLDVALRLDRLLRAKGLKTILTRDGDAAVSLASRAAIANRESNCVFVSIHFDEGGRSAASGVQTFYA